MKGKAVPPRLDAKVKEEVYDCLLHTVSKKYVKLVYGAVANDVTAIVRQRYLKNGPWGREDVCLAIGTVLCRRLGIEVPHDTN